MRQLAILVQIMLFAGVIECFSQIDTSQRKDQGISFEHGLTWQQLLQKAKLENKYIFVDCYASWCGPCKWMDQHVYTNDTVGDFINKAFIAVKVQMDTTQHDSTGIRDWYNTAHEMGEQYRISAYPTYLFFSPDGRAIHKAIGVAKVQDFLTLSRAAIDPGLQYYTLLAEYSGGSLKYDLMPYLANTAEKLQEDSLSDGIASDYLHHLAELPGTDLWTKENIKFIGRYGKVIHYRDTIFARYFLDKVKIDSIMGSSDNTWRLINLVVYNEDVKPKIDVGLKDGSEPNWHLMENTIAKRYGNAFVKKNVIRGRAEYYHAIEKWDKYVKYFVLAMQSAHIENWPAGRGTSMVLNNDAFEVFKYSNRKKELEEALSWIDRALSMNAFQAAELDTKANLLYKLGRNSEAIICEEKAHNLAPDAKDIQENYDKMKNGQPTW